MDVGVLDEFAPGDAGFELFACDEMIGDAVNFTGTRSTSGMRDFLTEDGGVLGEEAVEQGPLADAGRTADEGGTARDGGGGEGGHESGGAVVRGGDGGCEGE